MIVRGHPDRAFDLMPASIKLTIESPLLSLAHIGAAGREKSNWNFNHMAVRKFILNGAPTISMT